MKRNAARTSESGVALLLSLFALLIVTAMALSLMFLSDTETAVNSNFRDEQLSYYAARAGLEEARDRMRSGATNTISGSLPTTLPGSASGAVYILNPLNSETVAPWNASNSYFDDEFCKEISGCSGTPAVPPSGYYVSSTLSASTTYASNPVMPYKWTRITLKTDGLASGWSGSTQNVMYVDGQSANSSYYVCWNGTNEIAQSSACAPPSAYPVYLLTTLALTPSGSRRIVQSEVARDQINLTLPGALTYDGPVPAGAAGICGSGSTCNSGGSYYTGNEPSSGCSSAVTVPAFAVPDATSQGNLISAASANRANIVGVNGPGDPSPDASVGNASSALANLSTPAQIEALVAKLTGLAGSNTCQNTSTSPCSSLNLGTAASPTITVVNNAIGGSAFQLNSGRTGYGILVVTGTLDYVNVNSYQGVILMLGTAQFVSSSSKDTTLTGALFMAQDRDTTTGALLSSLGSPTYNFHHGSASSADPSIQYNQCIINQVSTLSDFKLIAQRERMY